MADTARDQDQAAIARLMTGWIHRDLGNWDELAALFHPGATIDISWIDGLATDFVEGSKKMGAGPARTKHLITQPVIRFAGDRAFVETYLNARAGHPFDRICATRGSELEAGIRRRGEEWLAGA